MGLHNLHRDAFVILIEEELLQVRNVQVVPCLPKREYIIEACDFLHVFFVGVGLIFPWLNALVVLPEGPLLVQVEFLSEGRLKSFIEQWCLSSITTYYVHRKSVLVEGHLGGMCLCV